MSDILKVLLFFVGGLLVVSWLANADIKLIDRSEFRLSSQDTTSSQTTEETIRYSRQFDTNRDGVLNADERRQSVLAHIGNTLDDIENGVPDLLEIQNASVYKDDITFSQAAASRINEHEQYVRIRATRSNAQGINISGWKLKSLVTGRTATIGRGATLPDGIARKNANDAVILGPGEEAIVTSGGSFGSFLINKCTGYFETFGDFTPSLPRECPLLEDEDLPAFGITPALLTGQEDDERDDKEEDDEYGECIDAIEDVYRCEHGTPPRTIVRSCRDFIRDYSTYDQCVALHKYDNDFYGDQWRVFLGSRDELWLRSHEIIVLLDQYGKTVDVVKY